MRIFQIIFKGGRVQNIMADRYHNRNGAVRFHMDKATIEYAAGDLIMIDELFDEAVGDTPRASTFFGLGLC